MIFLKKSIIRRTFADFLVFGLIVALVLFYVFLEGQEAIPFNYFIAALAVFVAFFLIIFHFEIVKPLKRILSQMKFLLAGKKYKKIYTTRIDEIGILAHFFNEVTRSFEKVSSDIKEERRMMGELEIAAKLQKDILPPMNPKIKGLDIIAKNRAAAELGGDSFDFISVGNKHYMYIGDVTGHGVPSALVMTMVNTLVHTYAEIKNNAFDIAVGVNKQLKDRISSTMFMTMMLLCWDADAKKMTYVGCGHEHLLIYRAGKGKCDVIKSGGIALGMVPDNSKLIKEIDVDFEIDDVIVLYSDGITEGRNMAGEMYGIDGVREALERSAPQYDSDGIVHHIALDYSRFVEEHVQDDDVTLIAIKYEGDTEKAKEEVESTTWSEKTEIEEKEKPRKKK
jgi:serine phosphatase RsbU (regulator of sigma subunit)